MKHFNLVYKPFGEQSILIEWPALIEEYVLNDIIVFKEKISANNIKQIIELTNAYNSLLIHYDFFESCYDDEVELLKTIYESKAETLKRTQHLWKIPVCYDATFGIDLEAISLEKNIKIEKIIKQHSETIYTVYFIGFLPGFLYLGGLDQSLHIPRKGTPRLKVESGAVGIGGNQTGIYPKESPGGWSIIGNSPINFFNVKNDTPCFAKAGDCIQFYAVSTKEHQGIKALVENNVYQIESEVLDG